jgi:dihydrofolate reductase/thymidylate synthase
MLIAIWAQDKNGLIGKDNHLPWHLPNDLRFFKEMTLEHTLVMGRKTFEGMGGRPLPRRQTIVLTHDKDYHAENVLIMHSLEEVLDFDKKIMGTFLLQEGLQSILNSCPIVRKSIERSSKLVLKAMPIFLIRIGTSGS